MFRLSLFDSRADVTWIQTGDLTASASKTPIAIRRKVHSLNLPRPNRSNQDSGCRSGDERRPVKMRRWTCIMLGFSLLVIATGSTNAAPLTAENQSVVRAGPGSTFSVIGQMPAGTKVEVTDCTGGWCQVNFNGITGFVSTADLSAARRSGNSPRSAAQSVHRSHSRVGPRSTPDRSVTRAAPSNKASDSSAHP
jgi:uncharacterized protein YraI